MIEEKWCCRNLGLPQINADDSCQKTGWWSKLGLPWTIYLGDNHIQ